MAKKDLASFELGESQNVRREERRSEIRKIRRLSPIGMRVVIRIRPEINQTDSGLYLPEGAKEAMDESIIGEVIEVASAIDQDTSEEANVSGIPLGATVLILKRAGIKVPWADDLRIVETKEVLAIVHEVEVL